MQKLKTQIYCSTGSFCPVKVFQCIQYSNVATIFVAPVSLGPNGVHAVQLSKGGGAVAPRRAGIGKAHAQCAAAIIFETVIT